MSKPEKEEVSCMPETQETCCEGFNKEESVNVSQNMSLNESQDFHLVDFGGESMTENTESPKDGEDNNKKLIDSQQTPNVLQSEVANKLTAASDQNRVVVNEQSVKNESVKKLEEDASSDVRDLEKKAKLSDDEDEIIQGTPPHDCYTPSKRAVSNIQSASNKRKAVPYDEPPTKVSRTMSAKDATDSFMQLEEEEENRQSSKFDDSYEELFKDVRQNIVIEETQDLGGEFASSTLAKSPIAVTTNNGDDNVRERYFEQLSRQGDVSKECYDMEKDENLNVSAKFSDADDSIIVNVTSPDESDTLIDKNNLPIEEEENITTSNAIIVDERSENNTLNETNKFLKEDMTSKESSKVERTTAADGNEKIPSESTGEVPKEAQPSAKTTNIGRSRISVELIYDGASKTTDESKLKPEIVQIDDDDEKILLDSSSEITYDRMKKNKPDVIEINDSHEDSEKIILDRLETSLVVTTINKDVCDSNKALRGSHHENKCSDLSSKTLDTTKESSLDSKTDSYRLVNGSSESKRYDTDMSLSVEFADTFSRCDTPVACSRIDNIAPTQKTGTKTCSFGPKDLNNMEVISISDYEQDVSNGDDNAKNKFTDLIHSSMHTKSVQVEREIGMYVKIKCSLQIDENTKEFLGKELTAVHCETTMFEPMRQKSDDTGSSSLADISDNKEVSPGSVNSNPQMYHLYPSRLSIMSSISSSSSASSAASLTAKLALKDNMLFSLPRGPAKHAKKLSQELPSSLSSSSSLVVGDKQSSDEYERLTHEWTNYRLLTTNILNCVNAELGVTADVYNVSHDRLDDHHLQKSPILETVGTNTELTDVTPKSTKKSKVVKRLRSKPIRTSVQTNDEEKDGAMPVASGTSVLSEFVAESDGTPNKKRSKMVEVGSKSSSGEMVSNIDCAKMSISDKEILANSSPLPVDDLIGRNVFAKWSDNSYYPGTVTDRLKTKYKVTFYDGKSKILIPDFIVPIPNTLNKGLSVYAAQSNDYGSCGIILDVHDTDGEGGAYYTVETDEGERLRVQVKDIFLSFGQVQVLKEEMAMSVKAVLPTTPKHLAQVTLDNIMDSSRRSKRIGTPVFSTPKYKGTGSANKIKSEPSGSGIKKEHSILENEVSSDSNVESTSQHLVQDDIALRGVQNEIREETMKGPQSRIKGKSRSKKKESPEIIATLGPIPPVGSNIFAGMSFIMTCASLNTLDRYQDQKCLSSTSGTEETETENEEEWTERPFAWDRLRTQIVAGSGKVYENFDDIPKDEYKNAKLITNVPNTTAKSILCLSVGIPAYNHKWVIRCCSEGKLVNLAEEALPKGWNLQTRRYVEIYQTSGDKPLSEKVMIIPNLAYDQYFAPFWQQVCDNAGAVVVVAENSWNIDFDSNAVIVSNSRCPTWAKEKASQLKIPILSTTWIIQCLIRGKFCPYDEHERYRYDYTPNH